MIEKKLNDNFCILPFIHMQIGNPGRVRICCATPWLTDEAGKTLNVYEHSATEIWNSKAMREVRRAMIEGKQVGECSKCWQQESNGGSSRRMAENAEFRSRSARSRSGLKAKVLSLLTQSIDPLEEIRIKAVREDFFVYSSPIDFELEVGNVCNLKCRMCDPQFSSKIEHDPVHSKWFDNPNADTCQEKLKPGGYPLSRLPEKKHWFKEKSFIYGELFKQPKAIQKIAFKGGEPYASQEAVDILEYLSTAGDPGKIKISIVTNGTIANAKLLDVTARFKHVVIAVSLDGIGSHYEYIRYPAKWSTVEENLRRFASLDNVLLISSIAFQAYNALQIVELFRYCDRLDYRIQVNALRYPVHLAAAVIPPKARQVAAQRISDYVETDCKRENRANISALARGLEALGNKIDMENLHKFMLFTNDLDQSRNQHFNEVHAELLGYIEEAGISWSDETRFAHKEFSSAT